MKELANRICERMDQGRPVAVATILNREGSAPRTAGSKMVIDPGGEFFGTIGGGKFEADVLTAAKTVLMHHRPQRLFFDLTGSEVAAMDMICGGAMTVLVDFLAPDPETSAVFNAWRQAQENPARAGLITAMQADSFDAVKTTHCLVSADRRKVGAFSPSDALLSQLLKITAKGGAPRVIKTETQEILVEPVIPPKTLLIFGAGHVSIPTARLAAEVGFRVITIDDRPGFASPERFPTAEDVVVINDFSTAFSGFRVDENTYIVIVTRGHRHDATVLTQALRSRAGYIGMIGSQRKRDAIFEVLRQQGFVDGDIARVYSPIGLSIGAESPEEIAVSITAELIAHRAGVAA